MQLLPLPWEGKTKFSQWVSDPTWSGLCYSSLLPPCASSTTTITLASLLPLECAQPTSPQGLCTLTFLRWDAYPPGDSLAHALVSVRSLFKHPCVSVQCGLLSSDLLTPLPAVALCRWRSPAILFGYTAAPGTAPTQDSADQGQLGRAQGTTQPQGAWNQAICLKSQLHHALV